MMALVGVLGAAWSGLYLGDAAEQAKRAELAPRTVVLQDSGDWLSESYWQKRRQRKLRQRQANSDRSSLGNFNPFSLGLGGQANPYGGGGSYRTVCVRLCDGYYFPISFSTTRAQFARDEEACSSRCSSETRLFVYPNAGGSPETMTDRNGRPYADLKTAFLYRTSYDKSCQCRPDPWSDAEKQRHAMYRTKGWQQRARRLARQEARRKRVAARRGLRTAPSVVVRVNGYEQQVVSGELPQQINGSGFVPQPYGLGVAPPDRQLRRNRNSASKVRVIRPSSVRQGNIRRRRKTWRARAFSSEN